MHSPLAVEKMGGETMTFRESINNLIRSDQPESPTDVIFIYGGLTLINLVVYAALAKTTIPHVAEIIGFLVLCKSVKMVGDRGKNGTDTADKPAA